MTRPRSVLAEFASAEALLEAARLLRRQGVEGLEAYSPTPVDGLDEVLGQQDRLMSKLALGGGLFGGAVGYGLQYWVSVSAYPLNVGGRPLHSWQAFIPITFECMVLAASLTLAVAFFVVNGFPRIYDPTFQHPELRRASRDAFFLAALAESNGLESRDVERLLLEAGATRTMEIEP